MVSGIRQHHFAIQMPSGVAEHRHHHGKPDEERHAAEHQEAGDDQPPGSHWHRIGGDGAQRREHRFDRAHIPIDPGRAKTVFLPEKLHATGGGPRRHDRLSIFLLLRVWSQPWRNLGPR